MSALSVYFYDYMVTRRIETVFVYVAVDMEYAKFFFQSSAFTVT